ncbi:MAG: hypothetical protein JOZ18_02225, partial [Chloroflexi bacterium]|nr:hypothetical protein [Chloroflexota bacterium]
AAGVLSQMGADLARAREETVKVLNEAHKGFEPVPPQAAALLAEGEEGHTCSRCGARYPEYFRHCFNCGLRSEDQ